MARVAEGWPAIALQIGRMPDRSKKPGRKIAIRVTDAPVIMPTSLSLNQKRLKNNEHIGGILFFH
jgi:hypothetical protein